MIQYHDESDLQRKIVAKLNANGYSFEITPTDFDAVDHIHGIYLEAKRDDVAPAQLLYAVAKSGVDPTYLVLASAAELRVYKCPSSMDIKTFADTVDPARGLSPSAVNSADNTERAMKLLGDHAAIWDYTSEFRIDDGKRDLFVTKDNFDVVRGVLGKYKINPMQYIKYVASVYSKNHEIRVNNVGKIINENTGEFFVNTAGEYTPITNTHDKQLIECLRVKAKDVKNILRADGATETIQQRRQGGRFFTKDTIATTVTDIVNELHPEYIVEPYVGAGSLIEGLVEHYPGSANDINMGDIDVLRQQYEGLPWTFTSLDMFTTQTEELIEKMGIPRDKVVAFVTNPPWGTSATNRLVSKKDEIAIGKTTRKVKIEYGDLGDTYGRGDAILPAVGRMVEMIKRLGKGYLVTFSQFSVFCGRTRYNKLLRSLLKDFEYVDGYLVNSSDFNGSVKNAPNAMTVWKYSQEINTSVDDLRFKYGDATISTRRSMLLKSGWKYDNRIVVRIDEIGVQHNESFNVAGARMFYMNIIKGGSQVVPENIKIELNVPNVPSELVYSLWSSFLGRGTAFEGPLYLLDAYVHLPDFTRQETTEILAYVALNVVMCESICKKKYCNGLIGFVGMSRIFKFGNERLTAGVQYLIDTYGDAPVGDTTIRGVFEHVKDTPDETDEYRLSISKQIREQIATRLDAIGYWDYIPIPMDF